MTDQKKQRGISIGIAILFLIACIFISLFSGEYDFTTVGEGRTTLHIGLFLLTWGVLIPISFRYSNISFIFEWIRTLESLIQFGKTDKSYITVNSVFMITVGVLVICVGLGILKF